jgi:hypothetical protein
MTSPSLHLVIDGQEYKLRFRGFDQPLTAELRDGAKITLIPWPLARHLQVLDRCCALGSDGLALNSTCLSEAVLSFSGVPAARQAGWEPLALWWAAAGGAPVAAERLPPPVGASGSDTIQPGALESVRLGPRLQARLRPWSAAERFAAVMATQTLAAAGGEPPATLPLLGAYLKAMLDATVQLSGVDAVELASLDAGSTAQLLDAVLRLNVLEASPTDKALLASPLAVEATLRFCRALGWTPSQVWRTPAAELDRLALLLDREPGGRPPDEVACRGLARHPDAVVIQVEDDDVP